MSAVAYALNNIVIVMHCTLTRKFASTKFMEITFASGE